MAGVRSLVVPGSLTSETPDPKIATYKIGLVGRAAAIFEVDEVVVYEDPAHKDARRVSRVLAYQAAAPYLRKRLFPLSNELAHVGVLPPLNLPLHLVDPEPTPGQLRFGAMVGGQVDIGLGRPAELSLQEDEEPPEAGEQFPVQVAQARGDRIIVRPHYGEPGQYLGYAVDRAPSLRTALKGREPILGTSRKGEHLSEDHLEKGGLTLVFGSPDEGIEELLGKSPAFPLVNTIPSQGTATVRVEEAVLSSLALIHSVTKGLPSKR